MARKEEGKLLLFTMTRLHSQKFKKTRKQNINIRNKEVRLQGIGQSIVLTTNKQLKLN